MNNMKIYNRKFYGLVTFIFTLINSRALINLLNKISRHIVKNEFLFFLLGKLYNDLFMWDESIVCIRKMIAINPHNPKYYWDLGVMLFIIGRYKEALTEFLFLSQSKNLKISNNEMAACTAMIGRVYLYMEKYKDAEEMLLRARVDAPWDLDICKGMVDLYYFTERFGEIAKLLESNIEKYPTLYPLYIWLAQHKHYYNNDIKGALELYLQAFALVNRPEIRLYCNYFVASNEIVIDYYDDYINAIANIEGEDKALMFIYLLSKEKRSNRREIKLYLIKHYLRAKNFYLAEIKAMEFVKSEKNSPEGWSLLALAQLRKGRFDDSLKSINTALSINNTYIFTLDALAEIQIELKLWSDAINTLEQIIAIFPLTPVWIEELGYVYGKLGDFEKAQYLYEKALGADPLNANAWVDLASIYLSQEKNNQAKSAYQKGLSYDWISTEKKEQAELGLKKLTQSKTR